MHFAVSILRLAHVPGILTFGHFVALTASIRSESSDSDPDEAEFDEEEVLKYYFNRGFNYQEILLFLSERHEHPLSYSTLLRRLKKYGLERRGVTSKEFNDTFCKVQRRMVELIMGHGHRLGIEQFGTYLKWKVLGYPELLYKTY